MFKARANDHINEPSVADLQAEITRLREALTYYVDATRVVDWGMEEDVDDGHVARAALSIPDPHHLALKKLVETCTSSLIGVRGTQYPYSADERKPAILYLYGDPDEQDEVRQALTTAGLVVTKEEKLDEHQVEWEVNFPSEGPRDG